MTRVVFVNPQDSSLAARGLGLKAPPLNLMYLAGAVEKAGFSAAIIDANLLNATPDNVAGIIQGLRPDLVGLTATTATLSKAFQYVRKIRDMLSDCFIFIGGPHVTFLPAETLAACRELDAVVIGEGEETVADLARSFKPDDPRWPGNSPGHCVPAEGQRERTHCGHPGPTPDPGPGHPPLPRPAPRPFQPVQVV